MLQHQLEKLLSQIGMGQKITSYSILEGKDDDENR